MNNPNCALCLKPVDEFDIQGDRDVVVFVSKCHGQTEAHRAPRMALYYGGATEPQEAFVRAKPISDDDVRWIERSERTFFDLVGRGLVACEDRGEYWCVLAPEPVQRVYRFHSEKCERRRLARRGHRGRRGSRRITLGQAMESLMPRRQRITLKGHRFGRAAKIETWRMPRELWPTVRRLATVYVEEGKTIPEETRAYLEAVLERAVIRLVG